MTVINNCESIEDFLKFLNRFELSVVTDEDMDNLSPEPLSHKKLISAYFEFRKTEGTADNRRKVYEWFQK